VRGGPEIKKGTLAEYPNYINKQKTLSKLVIEKRIYRGLVHGPIHFFGKNFHFFAEGGKTPTMGLSKDKEQGWPWWLIWLLPAFLVVVYALRLGALLRFLLPFLLLAAVFGYLFVRLFGFLKNAGLKKTLEEEIAEKLSFCRAERETTERAMEELMQHLRDLEAKAAAGDIEPQAREALRQLLEAYRNEYELRAAKKAFFERCIRELERVLANYRLNEELRRKRKRLEEFRRSRGLSPEEMEVIRQDIKTEAGYVQSIGELSRGMSESKLLDEVEVYRQRLEAMMA
jgi:signal transduction histidine kinase